MKTKYAIGLAIGLAVAGLTIAASEKERPGKHEIVILYSYQTYAYVTNSQYSLDGFRVYNFSSSDPEHKWNKYTYPDCPPLTQTANAGAELLNDGYRLDHTSQDGMTMTFVR